MNIGRRIRLIFEQRNRRHSVELVRNSLSRPTPHLTIELDLGISEFIKLTVTSCWKTHICSCQWNDFWPSTSFSILSVTSNWTKTRIEISWNLNGHLSGICIWIVTANNVSCIECWVACVCIGVIGVTIHVNTSDHTRVACYSLTVGKLWEVQICSEFTNSSLTRWKSVIS